LAVTAAFPAAVEAEVEAAVRQAALLVQAAQAAA